ncbi:MAG: glycosyltransferase [Planctomycetota bacterium]|nr:glycosyltransferase [Planctomycetota bacterium]
MKVLLVVGDGARERAVAEHLARELARRGHAVRVLIGARGDGEPRIDSDGTALRLVRTDEAPGHWQRSRSLAVARLLRAWLRDEVPDVVHVLAWRGLTHDLVALAAEAGVRAVVTLSDPWFACLVGDRVRRDTGGPCAEPLGPAPCLGCAEKEAGRTPWVPIEARFLAVAERRRDALRELELARRVLVADAAGVADARRALSDGLERVRFAFVADPLDAAAHAALYESVAREPAPEAAVKPPDWWVERMQTEAERAWDEAYRRAAGDARCTS